MIDTTMSCVKNYDINVVHMDDYFYPCKITNVTFLGEPIYKMRK